MTLSEAVQKLDSEIAKLPRSAHYGKATIAFVVKNENDGGFVKFVNPFAKHGGSMIQELKDAGHGVWHVEGKVWEVFANPNWRQGRGWTIHNFGSVQWDVREVK